MDSDGRNQLYDQLHCNIPCYLEKKMNFAVKMNSIFASKKNWIFLSIAFLLGLAVIFITPPIQGTDEDIHFTTIWKISHGEYSNTIPASLIEFLKQHRRLIAKSDQKYSVQNWENARKYRYSSSEPRFVLKDSMTYYAIFSYVPNIAAVRLTRFFTERYLPAFYAARIASLICFILLSWLAVRALPHDKWLLVLLLAMPSTFFQSTLVSYDGISYGTCALWFALLYRDFLVPKEEESRMSRAFVWCSILLCCCKLPYGLFLLSLSLILWKKEIKNRSGLLLLFICLNLFFFFRVATKSIPLPVNTESMLPCVDKFCAEGHELVDTLTQNKLSFIEKLKIIPGAIFSTVTSPKRILLYGGSFLGCLGWLDCLLPPVLLLIYLGVILFCSFSAETVFSWKERVLPLLNALGITFTIFVIFANAYNLVDGTIPGITGRYFIPGAIFLLFAMRMKWFTKKKVSSAHLYSGNHYDRGDNDRDSSAALLF